MAFDFSKISRPETPEEIAADAARRAADRRRLDDRAFAGRELREISAKATFEVRHEMTGGFMLDIVTPKGRATAVFSSARDEAGGEALRERLRALWADNCHKSIDLGTEPMLDSTDPILDVALSGIWKPRRWKNRAGETQTSWEFHVASWSYPDGDAGETATGGWQPEPAAPKAA